MALGSVGRSFDQVVCLQLLVSSLVQLPDSVPALQVGWDLGYQPD